MLYTHYRLFTNEEVKGGILRPQSAKQVRNYWVQSANDEGQTDSRHVFKHGKVKMGNFVSTSNDLSRLLPKRIQQDKERLYC